MAFPTEICIYKRLDEIRPRPTNFISQQNQNSNLKALVQKVQSEPNSATKSIKLLKRKWKY